MVNIQLLIIKGVGLWVWFNGLSTFEVLPTPLYMYGQASVQRVALEFAFLVE